MTEDIGHIGMWDQVDTAIAHLSHATATYYHQLRRARAAQRVALELTLQYQGYLLTRSAQANEPR